MKIIFALLQLLALVPIIKNWDTLKLGSTSRTVSIALGAPAVSYLLYAVSDYMPILIVSALVFLIALLVFLYIYRKEIFTESYRLLMLVSVLGLIVPELLKIQHYPGASLAVYFQYVATIVGVYVYFKDSESKVGILHSSIMVYLIIQSVMQIKTQYL
jgi:hypothetical protein